MTLLSTEFAELHLDRSRHRFRGAVEPQLSVVIPAYDETARLNPFLVEVRGYLDSEYPRDHEVIVVDDGSTDDTAALVERVAEDWPQLRLVRHVRNRGKGAAVRTGILAATGRRILFA